MMLRRRADFLAVRGGTKWGAPSFLIECRPRPVDATGEKAKVPVAAPRFGITVSKKVGNAVQRNRIRRRIREVLRRHGILRALPGLDYVIVARTAAMTCAFDDLERDFCTALERLHRSASATRAVSADRSAK